MRSPTEERVSSFSHFEHFLETEIVPRFTHMKVQRLLNALYLLKAVLSGQIKDFTLERKLLDFVKKVEA